MPVAPVDDKGTVLYYEDSGAPDGTSEYLTVVLIHGNIFHGAIFRPLLPFAASHRLRLVFVNMRDYPGSSVFSQEELENLCSEDPAVLATASHALGRDIALCLQHLILTLGIPPVSSVEGKRTGGVALLAWSRGNQPCLAMLAGGHELPDETQRLLGRYLRTFVMHDITVSHIGADVPRGCYIPLTDPALSLDERREAFCDWIACYSTAVDDLDDVTQDTLAARQVFHEQPDVAGPSVLPTVKRMSAEEFASVTHPAALRSYLQLGQLTKAELAENFQKAVFDTGGLWPDVDVLCLWCDMSVAVCVSAARYIRDRCREDGSAPTARKVSIVKVPGANHFPHWDSPEVFMNILAQHL